MELDEFVVEHMFYRLNKLIEKNQTQSVNYCNVNDENMLLVDKRVSTLETKATEKDKETLQLQKSIDALSKLLHSAIHEIDKTKLINLKQEIVVRTLHNMNALDAYDMLADTFSGSEQIDWDKSIRAELMNDTHSIGRTNKPIKEAYQESVKTRNLISKNGSSDEAMSQSFIIEKKKLLDRISVYIETFSQNTWQPIVIKLIEQPTAKVVGEKSLTPSTFINGWVDIAFASYEVREGIEYRIEIYTDDVYGYKIGMDNENKYAEGTSYSLFEGLWSDNNYDIGFRVWCYPSADENNATVYTIPKELSTIPESIVFEKEDTLLNGSINYYVSRNGGLDWKLLQPGISTDLSDIPEGNVLIIKGFIQGDSRIEAWGYVVARSET